MNVSSSRNPAARMICFTVAYVEDFPDDFFWATGAQAPTLLSHLLQTIDGACHSKAETTSRVIRLVDRNRRATPSLTAGEDRRGTSGLTVTSEPGKGSVFTIRLPGGPDT